MGYDWGMGWAWGFGMLFMLLFWVFVIAGTVWLVMTLVRRAGPAASDRPSGERSALRILEERLARGEIDVEEFRARRAAIEEGSR